MKKWEVVYLNISQGLNKNLYLLIINMDSII